MNSKSRFQTLESEVQVICRISRVGWGNSIQKTRAVSQEYGIWDGNCGSGKSGAMNRESKVSTCESGVEGLESESESREEQRVKKLCNTYNHVKMKYK